MLLQILESTFYLMFKYAELGRIHIVELSTIHSPVTFKKYPSDTKWTDIDSVESNKGDSESLLLQQP